MPVGTFNFEPLDIGPGEQEMLKDLAQFATSRDRVYKLGSDGLIPRPHVAEHAFSCGEYRGTFSLTKMPDGIVYRALAIGQPDGIPEPGAVTSIAGHLGFTGSHKEFDAIHPGSDWQLSIPAGNPGYLMVFQPLPGFGQN